MDVNLSKLMAGGQPTAEDLHKELLQSAWKDYVKEMVNVYISQNPPQHMTLEDIVQAIAPNSLTKLPKTLAAKCRKSLEDDPPLRVVLYRIQTEPKPDKNGKNQNANQKIRNKSVSFVAPDGASSKKK